MEALERIIDMAEKTNIVPGMLALIEEPSKTIERGFRLINLGIDTNLLIDSVSTLLDKVNKLRK